MKKGKRGRDATGKKKRWSEKRKMKDKIHMPGESLPERGDSGTRKKEKKNKFIAKQAEAKAARGPLSKKQQLKKAHQQKKRKPKQQTVDEVGDVILEHDWNDSFDEEEQEIKEEEGRKEQLAREAAAKGKRQIFVAGIPWTADADAVKKYFMKCGEIEEFSFPKDDSDRPKGIAFITFDSETAVAKALEFDGKDYEARALCVKIATSKQERERQARGGGADSDDDSSGSCFDDGSDSEDGGGGKGKGKGNGKDKGKGKAKGKEKGKGKKGKGKRN